MLRKSQSRENTFTVLTVFTTSLHHQFYAAQFICKFSQTIN